MSYKRLSGMENYGSANSTHSHLLDISSEVVELEDEEEELEFKKPVKISAVTAFKYCGATICIITLVMSWVTMAEKIQDLEVDYPHPYLLVYWVHSFYSLLYVVWKIWRIFPGNYKCNSAGDGLVTPKRMFFVSGFMGLVSLISAYFWYLSLPRTSYLIVAPLISAFFSVPVDILLQYNVAINTSIYQSSSAAVFVLAVILLGESVTILKLISLMMSVGGVCMVGVFSTRGGDDHNDPASNATSSLVSSSAGDGSSHNDSTMMGIVYLILSMVTYALFEVSAKKWLAPAGDTAPLANSLRGLGMMGVHTLVWMWLPLIIFHYTNIEVFVWPSIHNLELMFLSACLDIIFNASLLMCIALVSPLFASVGAILAIPTAMVWDYFTKHYTENYLAYIGTVLIVIGFVGFVISEVVTEKKKHKSKSVVSHESALFKKPTFGWI